jgi:hypothetical protein
MAASKSKASKKAGRPQPAFYLASVCLLAITAFLFILLRNKLPPEIPLYYGKPPGAKQIANKNFLVLPLLLSALLVAINYAIASLLRDKYLQTILAALSILLSLIATIAVIKIIFLVGNL